METLRGYDAWKLSEPYEDVELVHRSEELSERVCDERKRLARLLKTPQVQALKDFCADAWQAEEEAQSLKCNEEASWYGALSRLWTAIDELEFECRNS